MSAGVGATVASVVIRGDTKSKKAANAKKWRDAQDAEVCFVAELGECQINANAIMKRDDQ
ncbi:hypothetical protein C7W93_22930 [Glaciimonas sp. PCH181]|nr:hypothetical protein C7W93_22930 [Glaciimonas sp. PCH181]